MMEEIETGNLNYNDIADEVDMKDYTWIRATDDDTVTLQKFLGND